MALPAMVAGSSKSKQGDDDTQNEPEISSSVAAGDPNNSIPRDQHPTSPSSAVQFDKDALLASPSRKPKDIGADAAASRQQQQHHHQQQLKAKRASQMSLGGSTSYAESAAGGGEQTRHTAHPGNPSKISTASRTKVATVPPWARDDPPSPPLSPRTHASLGTRSRAMSEASRLALPPNAAQTASSSQRQRSDSDDDESESDGERGPTRFWAFTLPARYRSRLMMDSQPAQHTAANRSSSDAGSSMDQGEVDPEARASKRDARPGDGQGPSGNPVTRGWPRRRQTKDSAQETEKDVSSSTPDLERGDDRHSVEMTMRASMPQTPGLTHGNSFTRHQPTTPGWDSPWRPESRGGGSIEVGGYRFNHNAQTFFKGETGNGGADGKKNTAPITTFLLHNPFVPLLFRLVNIVLTTATLAVAIRIHLLLDAEDADDAVGSSVTAAIVFAPLTLLHVFVQLYMSIFSAPIGIWKVHTMLFYTLVDLVAVAIWSAETALSLDGYLTSSLVCDATINPFASIETRYTSLPQRGTICKLQIALITLVFGSLIAYVVVLIVSLFRMFVRSSKRSRR